MKNVICCLLILLCFSCGQTSDQKSNCKRTVINFFKWYHVNFEKIDRLDIVGITVNDSTYRIHFDTANKYLSILKSSKLFSEKFINDKINFFNNADVHLMKLRQVDGPAEGFEADLLLFSQEAENIIKDKELLKFHEDNKNENTQITVKWHEETRIFILNTSDCLIDSIYLQ